MIIVNSTDEGSSAHGHHKHGESMKLCHFHTFMFSSHAKPGSPLRRTRSQMAL